MPAENKQPFLISQGWIQAVIIVVLFGFFVLGFLAYETYSFEPPIPQQVTDTSGTVFFTGYDILAGQNIFLSNGLMEFGSIFGHGAYLGPDFTADYLHRAALDSIDFYGGGNSDRAAKISFWCLNLGLAWMVFATLFPLGILQLYHSVTTGYFDARSLKFLSNPTNALIEWLRLPGRCGIYSRRSSSSVISVLAWVRHFSAAKTQAEAKDVLFTEVVGVAEQD